MRVSADVGLTLESILRISSYQNDFMTLLPVLSVNFVPGVEMGACKSYFSLTAAEFLICIAGKKVEQLLKALIYKSRAGGYNQ